MPFMATSCLQPLSLQVLSFSSMTSPFVTAFRVCSCALAVLVLGLGSNWCPYDCFLSIVKRGACSTWGKRYPPAFALS